MGDWMLGCQLKAVVRQRPSIRGICVNAVGVDGTVRALPEHLSRAMIGDSAVAVVRTNIGGWEQSRVPVELPLPPVLVLAVRDWNKVSRSVSQPRLYR